MGVCLHSPVHFAHGPETRPNNCSEHCPQFAPKKCPTKRTKTKGGTMGQMRGETSGDNRGAESGEYEQGPTAYTPHSLCVPDGVGSVLDQVREGALSEDRKKIASRSVGSLVRGVDSATKHISWTSMRFTVSATDYPRRMPTESAVWGAVLMTNRRQTFLKAHCKLGTGQGTGRQIRHSVPCCTMRNLHCENELPEIAAQSSFAS